MKEARTQALKAQGIKPLPVLVVAALVALMIGFSTVISTLSDDTPTFPTERLLN